jgi:hypothetical protein
VKRELGKITVRLAIALIAPLVFASSVIAIDLESSTARIRPGTAITNQNWQQYRQFMSDGLIALFAGTDFWRLPADLRIEVGPTISISLPKKYLEDTVRYSSTVRLLKTSGGGYVPTGYRAGLPFPNPLDGDPALIAERIFWDCYYRYQPRVQWAPTFTYSLDRLGNMTQSSEVKTVLSQLAFLSEVDFPATVPDSGGYYFARFYEQIAPEQGKYSTELDLAPADPEKLEEQYAYIPTLRRSLRLSEAARCAPVFGSDYLLDDENGGPPGLPQLFQMEYLGEKRILVLAHASASSFDSAGGPTQLNEQYYSRGELGLVPFPKPSMGQWELRDTYEIALKRLPSAANNYCYSKRVMYVDKENYFGAGELDLYGPSGRLCKSQLVFSRPVSIPKTGGDAAQVLAGPSVGFLVNFADRHVTTSVGLRSCLNSDCAEGGYLDIRRYASPEALMKIVQ